MHTSAVVTSNPLERTQSQEAQAADSHDQKATGSTVPIPPTNTARKHSKNTSPKKKIANDGTPASSEQTAEVPKARSPPPSVAVAAAATLPRPQTPNRKHSRWKQSPSSLPTEQPSPTLTRTTSLDATPVILAQQLCGELRTILQSGGATSPTKAHGSNGPRITTTKRPRQPAKPPPLRDKEDQFLTSVLPEEDSAFTPEQALGLLELCRDYSIGNIDEQLSNLAKYYFDALKPDFVDGKAFDPVPDPQEQKQIRISAVVAKIMIQHARDEEKAEPQQIRAFTGVLLVSPTAAAEASPSPSKAPLSAEEIKARAQEHAAAEEQRAREYVAEYQAKHCKTLSPEMRPALFPEELWPYVADQIKPTLISR